MADDAQQRSSVSGNTDAEADANADAFVTKWQGVTASELSTSQSFLIELSQLLGVDDPRAMAEQDYMLERLRNGSILPLAPKNMSLALFDFDGTITTHETMPEFLRRSISRRRLVLGWLLLAPLVLGYKWRVISGTLVRRAIVCVGYSGVSASAVVTSGRDFAESYLPKVLRAEAMQRIAWHVAQGHKVVVVSGGLDVYLAPWCEAHGLELLCSSLQRRNGVLTGYYEGQQCVLAEKARRVLERYDLQAFTDVYAYGDTFEDRGLLGIATRKYYQWQEVGAAGGR